MEVFNFLLTCNLATVIFGEVRDNLNLDILNKSKDHAISKNIKFILFRPSLQKLWTDEV